MNDTQFAFQGVRYFELGLTEKSAGGFMETHTLLVVRKGSGYLELDGERYRLKARTMCYCPPGSIGEIGLTPASAVPLELFELQFEIWQMEERQTLRVVYGKRMEPFMDGGKLPYASSQELIALMQDLFERQADPAINGSRARAGLQTDAAFKQLMGVLLRLSGEQEPEEERLTRIGLAVSYMKKHFAEPITRNEMAKRVGLTPEHFSVSFKRATGVGFSEHLTRLRVEQAREALLGADRNLDRIAREVGYQDGMYLSRKFKQQFGLSPRDYVRRPKRIVSLQYLGHLLALGMKPAGTTTKLLHAKPYDGMLDEVADVGDARSLEEIAALQPDLIVTSGPNRESLAQLAPTICLPWGREDCLDELVRLGRALDREREAENWIAAFREKEERASARVAERIGTGATAAVFEFWSDRLWAVNIGYGRGLRNLYKTLHFRPPDSLADYVYGNGVGLQLTPAMLAGHAADFMFVTVWESRGGAAFANRVMSGEEWQSLPAVRNGNVFYLDLELFKYNDPLALEQQLRIQTELLTKVHKTTNEGQ